MTGQADPAARSSPATYSLIVLLRIAASSFLMSSGDSFGRSTLIVSSFGLPVKRDGQRYNLQFTNSISPGRQVLSNHGSSGP